MAHLCNERGLYVLSVTTTPSAWHGTNAFARGRIRTALGLHPQLAHERKTELRLFNEFLPYTPYVGEVGLDGASEFRSHWRNQIAIFNHVLDSCACAGGRIMSIHSRYASKAVLDCLASHPYAGIPILHWFSGSLRDLERAISMECWFSVGPAMLRGARGKMLVTRIPHERILTESDGPFAQIDYRSILPWEVDSAVTVLADLWGKNVPEAQQILYDNLQTLVRDSRIQN